MPSVMTVLHAGREGPLVICPLEQRNRGMDVYLRFSVLCFPA